MHPENELELRSQETNGLVDLASGLPLICGKFLTQPVAGPRDAESQAWGAGAGRYLAVFPTPGRILTSGDLHRHSLRSL